MTTPNPKISEMINNAPVQAEASGAQLTQIEDTQDELVEERDAVEDDVCGVAADDLRTYLETTKLAEIQASYPASPILTAVYLVFGATYGTIDYTTGNITDWQFLQDDIPFTTTYVRYEYPAIPPTGDPEIDDRVDDFDFGNDYITRPLDSGATYGLNAQIDAYESAKGIVTENKNKIEASEDVLKRYL